MPRRPFPLKRLAILAILIAALVFAVQGGEYTTMDLVRQHRQLAELTADTARLSRIVDSLKGYEYRVEHDTALQERIAREEFGMVRGNKELLYRFTDTDSVKR